METVGVPTWVKRTEVVAVVCVVLSIGLFLILQKWGATGASTLRLTPSAAMLIVGIGVLAVLSACILLIVLVFHWTRNLWWALRGLVCTAAVLVAVVLALLTLLFGLMSLVLNDGAEEDIGGGRYVGTGGGSSVTCYHRVHDWLVMDRDCNTELAPTSTPVHQQSPATTAPDESPEAAVQESTKVGDAWPGNLSQDRVVAQVGEYALVQVSEVLAGRGTYVAARLDDRGWSQQTVVAVDTSFVDMAESGGVLLVAFSPDPRAQILISQDDGKQWQRVTLPDEDTVKDMRFFQSFTVDAGGMTIVTGYPSWTDSEDHQTWHSDDGITWVELKE